MLHIVRTKLQDNRIIILLIVIAACIAYLPTAQPDISATSLGVFTDVGNVQNALSQWGTLHSTGYPLFSFLGAVFVSLLRLIGVAPALAASLFSTFWAILTLVVFYLFIAEWLADRSAALIATLLLGVGWAYWLFASYAEVYSFSTFVIVAAFWLALKADRSRKTIYLYGLALCCGMVVAHHRAIALALPAPLLIAAPALLETIRRHRSFVFKWIGLGIAIGIGSYIYVLIRLWMQAAWIWGDPSTPVGLWALMSGSTYLRFIAWPVTLGGWLDLIGQVGGALTELVAWPILLAGLIGLGWMLAQRKYRYTFGLIVVGLVSFLFAITVQGTSANIQRTFPGERLEDIPALLQTTIIAVLLGFAYLLHFLRDRSIWLARGGISVAVAVSVLMSIQAQPMIYGWTHDTTGRTIISAAQKFVADAKLSSPAGFFSPWSGEFWALAYGQDIEQSIPNFALLPNRANLAQALKEYGVLYTFEHTFYNYDLSWWKKHLGNLSSVYLSSAGDSVVSIAAQPRLSENDLPDKNQAAVPMGSSIDLRGWTVTPIDAKSWQVTLYWQARAKPDRAYSVFVHASDRDQIDSPAAIVAQADTAAPVYGWYPTTLWSPDEIIRDDHVIVAPADRLPKIVSVGLYYQDETGAFHNLGQQIIQIPPTP
jgi:hypothetical protein